MKDNRYQHQRWWVKLWRRRWYVVIIPLFLKYSRGRWETGERVGTSTAWSIAVGLAQSKMRWYRTHDEVFGHLDTGPPHEPDDSCPTCGKSPDERSVLCPECYADDD